MLENTNNSMSVLIYAKSGGRKVNLHLRNQLKKPNLPGKGVISFYYFVLTAACMQNFTQKKNWGVILTNNFDLYKINTNIKILVKINPKSRYLLKFCTLLYKHIFNHIHIAKRNYEFAPKILVYRLSSF